LLTDLPAPKLKVYPRYTVVAEKFEALVSLGMANSRLKDYFDLWILSQHAEFNGSLLLKAITATFKRRNTIIPANIPIGLSPVFSTNEQKQTQWNAFLNKNKLTAPSLHEIMAVLASFLTPLFEAMRQNAQINEDWSNIHGWIIKDTAKQ
jgi:hypothetical protein